MPTGRLPLDTTAGQARFRLRVGQRPDVVVERPEQTTILGAANYTRLMRLAKPSSFEFQPVVSP